MIRLTLAVCLAGAIFLAAAPEIGPKGRTEGIEVRNQNAGNRFPDGILFTILAASDAEFTSARLRYDVLPDRPSASIRAQCTAGLVVNCQAVVGNTVTSNLVPGAVVRYHWELEDADGNRLETEELEAVYEDDRFEWQSIEDGNLIVYFYFGGEETYQTVLRTARETVDAISTLLSTSVDFPVKIWVYNTADDLQLAVSARRTRGPNTSVRTLGEVGAADTALVSRDVDFLNIVRHELAHVVTNQATRNHIAFPGWINEGISTFSQRDLLPDEQAALDFAISRDRALPITSLTQSAQGSADTVSLFYGQSGSIISYMVTEFGEERFADFVAALRLNTLTGALMEVYGFDSLGLENGWRESVGLPKIEIVGSGGPSSGAIPTLVPLGSGQGAQGSEATPVVTAAPPSTGGPSVAGDEDTSSSSSLIIVVGVGVVVVILSGGYLTARRRRT